MKSLVYISRRKLMIIMIISILIFQKGPKVFANDKNDFEKESPLYYIETAEDFNNIRTTPSAIYILMNDINLEQYENWEPISKFSGTLDGRQNTIKGLKINALYSNLGLFGENAGIIQHLIIEGPQITREGAMGGTANIGAIAGKNTGQIEDVVVKDVNIDIKRGSALAGTVVGGLVGENTGTITDSHVTGKTKGRVVGGLVGKNQSVGMIGCSSFVGAVESNECIGGLVGNNLGKIENCFSQAYLKVVSGEKASRLGGITGDNRGDVSYSYASVRIEDGHKIINGEISGAALVKNDEQKNTLFYDKDIIGLIPNPESGQGKSTTQMKSKVTYVEAGWNFKSIWEMVDGEDYPFLRKLGSLLPSETEDPDEQGDSDETESPDEQEDSDETEDPDEQGDSDETEGPDEQGDSDETEGPDEQGDSDETQSPDETKDPQDPEDTENQDEEESLEDRKESDKTKDKGDSKEENKDKFTENPTDYNQHHLSAAKGQKSQVVNDKKELLSYFIKLQNRDLKELKGILVKYYLSKVVSQALTPRKSFGILTWISKYHIL